MAGDDDIDNGEEAATVLNAGYAAEGATVDAGTPEGRRRREKQIDREAREAAEFWIFALSTPVGRREIWKVIDKGNPFTSEFQCGPNGFPNEAATWFKAGQRDFVLSFLRYLSLLDRDGVSKMQDENDAPFMAVRDKRKARK